MDQTQILQFVNHGAMAKALFDYRSAILHARSILLLSPSLDDYRFVRKIFPGSSIGACFESDWNLDEPPPTNFIGFDLVLAFNVLMYSRDPSKWIENILKITKNFVFQDVKYRKRSEVAPYLGSDGDETRYALKSGNYQQPTFPLSDLPNEPTVYFEYAGIPNQCHTDIDLPIHVCAAIHADKGCIANKLSRSKNFVFFSRYSFFVSFAVHTLRRKVKKYC